ncbi:MAG TPA: dienelactone hydrolase family protein [Bacteroidia bacterium]|jgi:carboxymethylenebutenolidase|nr:dienelactone hydrolase family protein [Bacteroidia bacterium]
MAVKSRFITLSVDDGSPMQCFVSEPDAETGTCPGILVFQEAFGVNSHIRDITERLAAQGYVAIAPELFHRTAPAGFEGSYTDFAALAPHFQAVNAATLESDARTAYQWLDTYKKVGQRQIACIGFCMGGRASFIANTALPLKAAISFYGGGIAPELIKKASGLHAPMLFFWGGLDKHIPTEQIDAVTKGMDEAGKRYESRVIPDADHGFNNNEKPAYNAQAASEAWTKSLAFLKEKLG